MDFKRIATILGVAVMGYVGYYIFYYIYNILEWLLSNGDGNQTGMAILTAIITATIYTVRTRRQ